MIHRPFCLSLAFGGLLLAACGGGDAPAAPVTPTPPPVTVGQVALTPDTARLQVGESQVFQASVRSTTGAVLTDRTVSWATTDPAVATVDATGRVTAAAPGQATVRATASGVIGSAVVVVRPVPPARVVLSADSAVLFLRQTQTITARALNAAGTELTGRTVQWVVADTMVAQVSATGRLQALRPGTTRLTATIDGVSAQLTVRSRTNPVRATSHENFKAVGLTPAEIPLPFDYSWGFTDVVARSYGDFYGRGQVDLFTARIAYDYRVGYEAARTVVAEYQFWKRSGTTYVRDNSVLLAGGATPCLHPRKAITADFNLDGRPDIFLACHGFDKEPYPKERNQVILSQPDGRYRAEIAAPDVGFWHGAAAADLNDDGYPDIVAVDVFSQEKALVFLNNRDGTFTRETARRLPTVTGRNYFTVDLLDVNEDGQVDLFLAGHEFEGGVTSVWLNPGTGNFTTASELPLPRVPGNEVVVDVVATGTGASRSLWLSRTSGGDGTFYASRVLQLVAWPGRTGQTVVNDRPGAWVPWLITYERNGQRFVGSDDPRTPLEVRVP